MVTITPQASKVKPIRLTLEDHMDYLERDIAYNGHIQGLLADAEALNDEIEHLRAVAQRAQQREVEAVKQHVRLVDGIERICSHLPPSNELSQLWQVLKAHQ